MKTITISYNIVRSSEDETTYMLIEILNDRTAKNVACEIAINTAETLACYERKRFY